MKRVLLIALMLLLCANTVLFARAETTPLRLLVGKREMPLSPQAVYDGRQVHAPVKALEYLGISYVSSNDNTAVSIALPEGSTEFPLTEIDGTPMANISNIVDMVGGEINVDAESKCAVVMSNLKSVGFVDGRLYINCTIPVVYSVSTWDGKIIVDAHDTKLTSEAKEVYIGNKIISKARLGQKDDTTSRVVLDLVTTAGYEIESKVPASGIILKVAPGLTPNQAPQPKASNQPFDITGISVNKINDYSFNLVINTSGRGSASITSSLNPSEITLTLKGGTIAGSVDGVKSTHPLIRIAKYAQVSTDSPVARVFLSLKQMVLSRMNVDDNAIVVNVSLPEKAGGKLAEKLIVIDPGHGGAQIGAQSNGTHEKNLNLKIAQNLAAALEAEGARVIFTRSDDSTMDLSPRPAVATANNADFFISVHCNSTVKPNSASGIETYHYRYGDSSPLLAKAIQKAVCANTGMSDRNARGSSFKVLRLLYNTGIPGVLVECGYINHSSDRAKLLTEDYRNKLTQGIVEGLRSYIEGIPDDDWGDQ